MKVAATRGYGAEVVLYDRARGRAASRSPRASPPSAAATVVPPFDHPDVIAGQGTCTKELIEDVGALDYLFVCTGGAGLLSGCAIAANHLSPGTQGHRRRARRGRRRAALLPREAHRSRSACPTPSPTARAPRRRASSRFRLVMRARARHHHGHRRAARRGDALPLGAHEAGGRAHRGARHRRPCMNGPDRRARQARGHHPLRRQRRPESRGETLRLMHAGRAPGARAAPGQRDHARWSAGRAARSSAGASWASRPTCRSS